jgi:NAD+ kinase
MDPKKRPIAAVADNHEVRNIKNITVKTNKKIHFKILFDSGYSLIKKIKSEQKKVN